MNASFSRRAHCAQRGPASMSGAVTWARLAICEPCMLAFDGRGALYEGPTLRERMRLTSRCGRLLSLVQALNAPCTAFMSAFDVGGLSTTPSRMSALTT